MAGCAAGSRDGDVGLGDVWGGVHIQAHCDNVYKVLVVVVLVMSLKGFQTKQRERQQEERHTSFPTTVFVKRPVT